MMAETLTLRSSLQGGLRRQWQTPLASGPTQQGDCKGASRPGLSTLTPSLCCAARPIAKTWDHHDGPRDHRQRGTNSAHQRINQRLLSPLFIDLPQVLLVSCLVDFGLTSCKCSFPGHVPFRQPVSPVILVGITTTILRVVPDVILDHQTHSTTSSTIT
jgi:hypothetical protein